MMNPIALFTYYVTRTVSMGDVGDKFFVGRKITRRIVYGPGVIAVTDGVTIAECTFVGCDFFVVAEGTCMQAALEMRDTTCRNTRFQKMTFIGTQIFADLMKAGCKEHTRDNMNIVYGAPVPIPVGVD